jgi:hypothetical protein
MIDNGRALQSANDFPKTDPEIRPAEIIIQSPSQEDKGHGTETTRHCSPVRGDHHRGEKDFAFIRAVPASWDETPVLSGRPIQFIAVARRSGEFC